MVHCLKKNIEKIFASGLSSIAFGIHNKKNLPVVMPQIKELMDHRYKKNLKRPKTYFDIVVYRENKDQIKDLVKAAAELKIDFVVLHRVFNIQEEDPSIRYISLKEERDLFAKVKRAARKLRIKLYLPPQPSFPCKAVKHSIFVTSEGRVAPCPYLCAVHMGNGFNGGVKKIIYSKNYNDFVRSMNKHPVCNRCPLGSTSGEFYSHAPIYSTI